MNILVKLKFGFLKSYVCVFIVIHHINFKKKKGRFEIRRQAIGNPACGISSITIISVSEFRNIKNPVARSPATSFI